MLHSILNAVPARAVVGTVGAVALLMACGTDDGSTRETDGETVAGAAVYASACAGCHGVDGGGASGPELGNGVMVEKYPEIDDQIAVIAEGLAAMPAFGESLTAAEIEAVAVYTREAL